MKRSILSLTLLMSAALSVGACSKTKFKGATQSGIGFSQKDENAIAFGDDDVFRIGDGSSGIQSACASELKGYDLKGTTYYFQFEVLEDASPISLSIDKICGVDRADGTFISLVDANSGKAAVEEIAVPVDSVSDRSVSYSPFKAVTLNKGTYSVVVRSQNVTGKTGPAQAGVDEFDDFIIGKLNLTSKKKVKAIKVYAE